MPKANGLLRERAAGGQGLKAVFPFVLRGFFRRRKRRNPTFSGWGFCLLRRSLTITYFHTGNPHYHRRGVVSRSCSGWEGVGPTRYGHQA